MQRRREIAASPRRRAVEAWRTIASLIADSLDKSSSIHAADVDSALDPLGALARMMISAGHLEKDPLVLVAGELWLEVRTVSGGAALTMDENLNPVPGAGGAEDWTLFVPQVEPMAKLVRTTVKGHAHLSADKPAVPSESASAAAYAGSVVDLDALAHWAEEGV